jgi:hypothetical protein
LVSDQTPRPYPTRSIPAQFLCLFVFNHLATLLTSCSEQFVRS